MQLSKWAMIIEKQYKMPMDIEWAKDGLQDKLFILQARPETVHAQKKDNVLLQYRLKKIPKKFLTYGISIGNKIGQGKVKNIKNVSELKKIGKGDILVTKMTDPSWEPAMKKASAIVTESGGRTCFSGETKILTNEGFLKISEITRNKIEKELFTLSINRDTYKIEWKRISDVMSRFSKTISLNISQTGRHKNNYLSVTSDHKFITLQNRTLIDKEIRNIIKARETILAADRIQLFKKTKNISKALAYLWGCIYTDGSIYLTKRHGEVQFIQKQTKEKELLIATVKKYFDKLFNKKLGICEKKLSQSKIRGKQVIGSATAFRCYSKEIAQKFKNWKIELPNNLLNCDEKINYHFLAGVIDGDGTFNKGANKINIFCSDEILLQAIVISCLKLNILPQISNNRNIHNIQIVDKIDELLRYTKRVRGKSNRIIHGTKFLSAKQLFNDIANLVNFKGRTKVYINKNLLIDKEKIRSNILPLLKGNIKKILLDILNANFVSIRVKQRTSETRKKVYNISVEDNHNYLVFTSKYTPIIVNNCHAAIVSRELGIPCLVGTKNATKVLKNGQEITVDCAQGAEGYVYTGLLAFKTTKIKLGKIKFPKTQIMMNIGNPDIAFSASFIPNQGVGLAREEFIISDYIKIHPLALINFETLSKGLKNKIEKSTPHYEDKKQFFIDKLAEGIGQIAAAFYPKETIVRFSDFKTNEYRTLIGGDAYEPIEANPMLGWRGASRYYDPKFKPAFILECQAIKKVINDFGLKNIKVMVPFCRTVAEGREVMKIIKNQGLKKFGVKVYVMVEIPNNVLLAEKFAKIFDGFSIGSNDLTQLVLGVDRDSEFVSHIYNEKDSGVLKMIAEVIKVAKEKNKKIGICGQAPSDFPEFAKFLVKNEIDSMSLSPDSVLGVIRVLKR